MDTGKGFDEKYSSYICDVCNESLMYKHNLYKIRIKTDLQPLHLGSPSFHKQVPEALIQEEANFEHNFLKSFLADL